MESIAKPTTEAANAFMESLKRVDIKNAIEKSITYPGIA
jgi:hypothetical protein